MQLLLPIFSPEIKLITESLGVLSNDGIVIYNLSGLPIYSHAENDLTSFRFITSKFILEGLCSRRNISTCFGVSYDSVKRYVSKLNKEGDTAFFRNRDYQGSCYKLLPDVLVRMQKYLDEGKNNCEIAKLEKVTEGTIRYAIKRGKLKKKIK